MTDQLKRAINAAKTAQSNSEQTEASSSSAGEQHFDMSESSYKTSHTAVRKARRFAMQGLYEWLVTDRRFDINGKLGWKDNAPHDIAARTRATNAMHTVHIGYYHEMMRDIPEQIDALNALISQQLDRDIDKLDTVEHAILLIGAYELQNRLEIPYKVVLDEAMKLNNHFGATDAHKLINAVLDKMAIELRAVEVQADSKANMRTSQKAATKQAQAVPVAAPQSDIVDNETTVSTKPRISANKSTVKRNRNSKAHAGTSTAKVAAVNKEANPTVTTTENNAIAMDNTTKNENTDNTDIANIVGASVTTALSEAEDNIKDKDIVNDDIADNDQAKDSVKKDSDSINNPDIDSTTIKSTDIKSND